MLTTAATRESYEQSTKNRTTAALIHGIAALIIASEGSGDRKALKSFAAGVAISELKIRTAPKQLIRALREYQQSTADANGKLSDAGSRDYTMGF